MLGALFDLSTFSIQLWPDAFNPRAALLYFQPLAEKGEEKNKRTNPLFSYLYFHA